MAPSQSIPVALIELVKGLLWPAVVGIGLVWFAAPIRATLDVLPTIIARAETLDLGNNFKIRVNPRQLPSPPSEVAKALSRVDDHVLQLLLETGDTNETCDNKDGSPNYAQALVDAGFATHTPPAGGSCGSPPRGYIVLNALGRGTRKYMVDLVSAQIAPK